MRTRLASHTGEIRVGSNCTGRLHVCPSSVLTEYLLLESAGGEAQDTEWGRRPWMWPICLPRERAGATYARHLQEEMWSLRMLTITVPAWGTVAGPLRHTQRDTACTSNARGRTHMHAHSHSHSTHTTHTVAQRGHCNFVHEGEGSGTQGPLRTAIIAVVHVVVEVGTPS
jgi:hypothetical protein